MNNRTDWAIVYVWLFAITICLMTTIVCLIYITDRVVGLEHSPEHCARRLGIAYSIEHGATERLEEFEECVK